MHDYIIQTFGITVLLNTLDVGSLMDMKYEVFMKSHIVTNFFGKINFWQRFFLGFVLHASMF